MMSVTCLTRTERLKEEPPHLRKTSGVYVTIIKTTNIYSMMFCHKWANDTLYLACVWFLR